MIHEATVEEIPGIVRFMKQFEQVSGNIKVDIEYATKRYVNMVTAGVAHMFVMNDEKGDMIGGLGCIVAPDLTNSRIMAIETYWFMAPGDRGKGISLLTYFEQWAKERGIDAVAMIHLNDSYPKALERLYIRRGYVPIETHYVKELRI